MKTEYILLIIAFTSNSLANILVKIATQRANNAGGWFTSGILSPAFLYLGLSVFILALAFLFYVLAVRGLPVSLAYAVHTAMSLVIITALAPLFSEKITLMHISGIFFLLLGISIIMFPQFIRELF